MSPPLPSAYIVDFADGSVSTQELFDADKIYSSQGGKSAPGVVQTTIYDLSGLHYRDWCVRGSTYPASI
jgi:hypothetical protein